MYDMKIKGKEEKSERKEEEEGSKREERIEWKIEDKEIILKVMIIIMKKEEVILWRMKNLEIGYEGFELIGMENYEEILRDRKFMIQIKKKEVYKEIVEKD